MDTEGRLCNGFGSVLEADEEGKGRLSGVETVCLYGTADANWSV